MSTGGRPASVRRHLNRPLLYCGLLAVAAMALLGLDARAAAGRDHRLDAGLHLQGTVDERRSGQVVSISYENPVTAQRISVPVEVWRAAVPDVGAVVGVDVALRDPEEVALAGDRQPGTADLWWYLPLVGLPLVVWALRRRNQVASERLIASETTTFSMLASLAPPRFGGRRCELSLYPVDSTSQSAPVATIGVLNTSGLPFGAACFSVEVKGAPRPHGRVVARAGPRMLWPAGRALSVRDWPRPALVIAAPKLSETAHPGDAKRVRASLATPGGVALPNLLAALCAAVVVSAGIAGLTLSRKAEADNLSRSGIPAVVEVVERGTTDVTVTYSSPQGGEARRVATAVSYPGDYTIGRRYPAHVGSGSDMRLRIDREPYDASAPIAWGSLPALVLLGVVVRGPWVSRQIRKTIAAGPTVEVDAVPDEVGHVRLRPRGLAHDLCRIPLSPLAMTGPAKGTAAGTLDVGSWVAVSVGGRWLPVTGRAEAPAAARRRPWGRWGPWGHRSSS